MYLLVAIVVFLLGTDACVRSRAVVRLTCPKNRIKTADKRSTSAMVQWGREDFTVAATRPIKGIYQTVPNFGESVTVRKMYREGTTYVEYKAVDDGGNFQSCSFTVTVKVIRCLRLHNPQFGILNCDSENLYGSKCTLTCIKGYSIMGPETVQCKHDGSWSHDTPFCRTTTCPDPGTPLHGTRLCTTATHSYGSICSFACADGYMLDGAQRLICQSEGSRTDWSHAAPSCKEITAPRLEKCPSNVQVTTSRVLTEVQRPAVVFRTGDGKPLNGTCSYFGDKESHNFTLGRHHILCKAFDPAFGEEALSVCKFIIRVKPNPCRALVQPLNGVLLCSMAQGGGTALHDTTCKLFCNKGYAMARAEGLAVSSATFECDHTGTWQPTHRVPSCVRPKRPQELNLPSEMHYTSSNCSDSSHLSDVRIKFQSALQATVMMQNQCIMSPGNCLVEGVIASCKARHDSRWRRFVAGRHRKHILAATSGVAIGAGVDFRYHRHRYYLSSRNSRSSGRRRAARHGVDVDNGDVSDVARRDTGHHNHRAAKRRREAVASSTPHLPLSPHHQQQQQQRGFVLPIQFHFATRIPEVGGRWPDEYHSAHSRLLAMFDYFERIVLHGDFTIRRKVASIFIEEIRNSLTYAPVQAICDVGYKFNSDILLCVPCGAGTHYDFSIDQCVPCKPGFYQNEGAQLQCKKCPPGTASVEEGTVNVTQCFDIDECESSPCLHGGKCIDGHNSYSCVCIPGYTGKHCAEEIYDCSRHGCRNGGSCIPHSRHNYSCQCRQEYTGMYCEYQTVDGGWSPWSEWGQCSESCEGGTTVRKRRCNSPHPTNGGRTCNGASMEMRVCNQHPCPVCKRLRRPYQGFLECQEFVDEDLMACTVSCPPGFDFSAPVFPVYVCGRNTSYLWPHESPDNPRCVLPACTRISPAEQAMYEFHTTLPVPCPSKQMVEQLKRQINRRAAEMTSAVHCLATGKCSLEEPLISGCVQRPKRSAAESSTGGGNTTKENLVIEVALVYRGSIGATYSEETSEFNETVLELSELQVTLEEQTLSRKIFINVGDQKVWINPNSTSTYNKLVCHPGTTQSPDGRHCVECSPGSFYHSETGLCNLCEEGTFQPWPAQTSCTKCPRGQTTYGRGAVINLECYGEGEGPPSIPEDWENYRDGHVTLKTALATSFTCLLVFMTLCSAIFFIRRRYCKQYNIREKQKKLDGKEEPTCPEEVHLYSKTDPFDTTTAGPVFYRD